MKSLPVGRRCDIGKTVEMMLIKRGMKRIYISFLPPLEGKHVPDSCVKHG